MIEALLIAALAAAAWYGASLTRTAPRMTRSVVKTVPLALGAVIAALVGGPALLIAGLALSALGDLALSRDGERAFLIGLGAFLAAHLAYIALFAVSAEVGISGWRLLACAGLVAYSAGFYWRLQPSLGPMAAPVALYVAVIAVMGMAALFLDRPLVWIGALLFMASDSVLSLELFAWKDRPRPWTGRFIWISYIGAQICIAAGFLI